MVAIIFFLLIYCAFLQVLLTGWNSAVRDVKLPDASDETMISIIVPLRNEAHNVKTLLESFSKLQYGNYEIIMVDDHSEDQTRETLNQIHNKRLTFLTNSGAGKKKAITRGVQAANGSIIVTTDGDCTVHPDWLKFFNHTFQDQKLKLAFGGVSLNGNNSWFFDLQAIEFSSLIGSGASTAAMGIPILCNGANMGYRKTIFEEVNGYDSNFHIASGDDEFLMRKVRQLYPDGIRFIPAPNAVVKTSAPSTLRSFFQQRIRWAGKWRHNSSAIAITVALFILFCQVFFIIGLISLIVKFNAAVITLLIIKVVLEGVFLHRVSQHLKQGWSWPAFAALQIFYPFYVVFTGIVSNFVSPFWKGRRVQT